MKDDLSLRLSEIELALKHGDINKFSRRLLDFTYEYESPESLYQRALDFRKKYNEQKELGSNKISSTLKDEGEALLESALQQAWKPQSLSGPVSICEVQGVAKRYGQRGSFQFEPLDLSIQTQAITGVVGENGNGKTTLLRMLASQLAPTAGEINYAFVEDQTDFSSIRKDIIFIPQRVPRWFGTLEDNLSFFAANKAILGKENRDRVEFMIHRMGLTNFRNHRWSQLSSGYKLRFEIVRALIWSPQLLILDEPLANLDLQAQDLLLQDLRYLCQSIRNPMGIVLSSQNLHEVEAVADRIIFLKNGKAVFNGNPLVIRQESNEQVVELSGTFDHVQLKDAIGESLISLEIMAGYYVVTLSESTQLGEIIARIFENGYKLDYFRDITGSTKKLFSDKY